MLQALQPYLDFLSLAACALSTSSKSSTSLCLKYLICARDSNAPFCMPKLAACTSTILPVSWHAPVLWHSLKHNTCRHAHGCVAHSQTSSIKWSLVTVILQTGKFRPTGCPVAIIGSAPAHLITYDEILCAGKGWQYARYCSQVIGINDAFLRAHELGNFLLQGEMHINGAIETPGTARAQSILVYGVSGLSLQQVVLVFNQDFSWQLATGEWALKARSGSRDEVPNEVNR